MHRRQNHLVDDKLRLKGSAAKSMSGRPRSHIHFFPIPSHTSGATPLRSQNPPGPPPQPHLSLSCFYDCSGHRLPRCRCNDTFPAGARRGDVRWSDDYPHDCDLMRKKTRKKMRTTDGTSLSPPYIGIFQAATARADASSAAGRHPDSEKTTNSLAMNLNLDASFLNYWNYWNYWTEAASHAVRPPGRDTYFPSN